MEDLLFELNIISSSLECKGYREEAVNIEKAIDVIKKQAKALELYKRERDRFSHTHPELTGDFFLTGGVGERDNNQLPEYVEICPAYGASWTQLYKRTDKTIKV